MTTNRVTDFRDQSDVSAALMAVEAKTKIDAHVIECTASNQQINSRLSRLEAGMIAAVLGIMAVLWQNYSATHPATTTQTVTSSVSTTTTPKH